MEDNTRYFIDLDTPNTLVRKRADMFELEFLSARHPVWTVTQKDSAYEREYYLGEGNNCLIPITREEAAEKLAVWGAEP